MTRTRLTMACPSFGTYGGMQAVILAIAEEVSSSIDVRLLFKLLPGHAVQPDLLDVLRQTGISYRVVDPDIHTIVRHFRGSDIVHVHEPSPDLAIAARLAGAQLGISIYKNAVEMPASRRAKSWVAMRAAHRLWFISDFVGESWKLAGRPHHADKAPTVSRLPSGSVAPAERRGFLMISRLIENKGHEELLRAYASADLDHARFPLCLVGEGPLRERLQRLVVELGLSDSVCLRGFVSDAVRDDLLTSAAWLVAPANTREDLGLTPIEARSVGVPCIVTNDGGLPEAGGPSALRCEPGDVGSLVRCLERAAALAPRDYAVLSARVKDEYWAEHRSLGWYREQYEALAAVNRSGRR